MTLLHVLLRVVVGIFEPSDKLKHHDPDAAKEVLDIFRKTIEESDDQKYIGLNEILAELGILGPELEQMLGLFSNELSQFRDIQMIKVFTHADLLKGRYETNSLIGFFNARIRPLNPKPRALELLQRLLDSLTAQQHASMIFIWLIARRVPKVAAGLLNIVHASNSQRGAQ